MARTLITGGTVVSMDPQVGDFSTGDVLIEDRRIVDVGGSIEASGCDVIDATGMVVMPGLADSQRHLWYNALRASGMDHALGDLAGPVFGVGGRFTAEDLYATTRAGIAYALDNGVTTMWHECQMVHSADHALEAIRAHRELPARAVVVFGPATPGMDWPALGRLRDEVSAAGAHVSMGIALMDMGDSEALGAEVAAVRELGLRMQIGGGFPMGTAAGQGFRALAQAGLLGPDMDFVHCNTTSEDEFRAMLNAGATATSCPMTEILVGLGLPAVRRMRAAGLAPAIGTDALCAGTADMLENARTALILARAESEANLYRDQGRPVATVDDLGFSAREALEAVTINAARSCGLGELTGSLRPGKAADIILLRSAEIGISPFSDPVSAIVCTANGSHVDTVLVDGQIVKRDGELVGIDGRAIASQLSEAQDRLLGAVGAVAA